MRKLFNEFFYVSNREKIRDKVILTRLIMTITIVVICLIAMSVTAYAYFTHDITSRSNNIKSATFSAQLSVQLLNENGEIVETVQPITSNYRSFKITDLKPNELYTVIVTPNERSTAKTGYLTVSATNCNETYHTQQLGIDKSVPGEKTSSITFKLAVTKTTEVILFANWGTSSYYPDYVANGTNHGLYITQNEEIKMIISDELNTNTNSATSNVTIKPATEENTSSKTQSNTSKTTSVSPSSSQTTSQTTFQSSSQPNAEDITTNEASSSQTETDEVLSN